MLIHGKDLNQKQREVVLAAFGYRWTKENVNRASNWHGIKGAPTVPLISDDEWLKKYSFHFTADGVRLHPHRHFCEPYYGGK